MASVKDLPLREFEAALAAGDPIRRDFGRGERLHIDRPMPFLVVQVGRKREPAARDIVTASSSYLLVGNLQRAKAIIALVADAMNTRFGHFMVLDIGELPGDRLASDADYLPPFEVTLSASTHAGMQAAAAALAAATTKVQAKFRRPELVQHPLPDDPSAKLGRLLPKLPFLTLRFAPIYRVPETDAVYPQLIEQLVANLVDAGLQAIAAFAGETKALAISNHRALGRRAFVDAVIRADKAIDEVAQSFDFLLAVTPINASAAWAEFAKSDFSHAPDLLYRPLAVSVDQQKKRLFSVSLDHFEDPVLTTLYREKQQELDLQLSMLAARETPRFVELGRALYGAVEPSLLRVANEILDTTKSERGKARAENANADLLERHAKAMIKSYADSSDKFDATVELRDDLPGGMMVSGGRLLISRSTVMDKARVEALLSHEVGVHLLTYFNGSAQGLRLFRSGLAGYEGVQEGLAVLAEYLVGGMTVSRLRLLAARVVGCAAMLGGATFPECYQQIRKLGLPESSAFNLVLRVYRGGGLAKDAVYLRGLLEVLAHLRAGGALDPFWMGKIAASHFGIIQELSTRGLLKAPQTVPAFLAHEGAEMRLKAARAGLSPTDMIVN